MPTSSHSITSAVATGSGARPARRYRATRLAGSQTLPGTRFPRPESAWILRWTANGIRSGAAPEAASIRRQVSTASTQPSVCTAHEAARCGQCRWNASRGSAVQSRLERQATQAKTARAASTAATRRARPARARCAGEGSAGAVSLR
jgi:hypothetical protein